ncbi:hypothetical protein [Chitinimonas taiwanensis]|uniref:hypothetical protein n=1 Tax=Chitinimonas taiwanensis TaxID=240412 RepID=UPI0035AE9855
MSRDDAFKKIKDYGLEATLGLTAITTAVYAFFANYGVDTNQIVGKFVGIVLNGVTAAASLVAFAAVLTAAPIKWGEVADLRTYIGIGSLIGLIASVVSLVFLFKAA